jgi:hypothetical protein
MLACRKLPRRKSGTAKIKVNEVSVAGRLTIFSYTKRFDRGATRPNYAPVSPEVNQLRHEDIIRRNTLQRIEHAKKPARPPGQFADVRTGLSPSEYTAITHPMHRAIVEDIRRSPIYKKLADEYQALPGASTLKSKMAKRREIRQHLKTIINRHNSPYLQIARAKQK